MVRESLLARVSGRVSAGAYRSKKFAIDAEQVLFLLFLVFSAKHTRAIQLTLFFWRFKTAVSNAVLLPE